MSVYLQKVLDEIVVERQYQDCLWGLDFDAKNNLDNWIRYITTYCGRAGGGSPSHQRRDMLKAAAIAVAACESFDRNNGFPPRHYEDTVCKG